MASQAISGAAGAGSGAAGGDSGAAPPPVLVGNVGQDFVQGTLTTMEPVAAIQVGAACRCPVGRGKWGRAGMQASVGATLCGWGAGRLAGL